MSHNTRGWAPDRTDPAWAERVEREAARITDQAETRWHAAQRRLARAEQRAREAQARPEVGAKRVTRLWEVVEQRRAELHALERLTHASPASAQHRGRGAHRGVGRAQEVL